jgi:hypothetical protein
MVALTMMGAIACGGADEVVGEPAAEDGQVRVFCIDVSRTGARFVERTTADYANRTSLGACPA